MHKNVPTFEVKHRDVLIETPKRFIKTPSESCLLFDASVSHFLRLLEILAGKHEVRAEVFLTYHGIHRKLFGSTLEEDVAIEQQIGTVGQTKRFQSIVVGDEDTDVLVLQLPHDVLDVLHGNRVDTRKRLVEHDELRVDGQASGNLRASAFTPRELVAKVLAHLLKAELIEQFLQLLFLFLFREVGQFKHRSNVVLHAHLAENGCRKFVIVSQITPVNDDITYSERIRGFKAAIRDLNLELKEIISLDSPTHIQKDVERKAFHAVESLLNHSDRPDAVCCVSDPTAEGARDAVRSSGINSVKVSGYDCMTPEIILNRDYPTVRVPYSEMALTAMKLINSDFEPGQIITLAPEIVSHNNNTKEVITNA